MIPEEHYDNLQKSAPKVAENIHAITEHTFKILLTEHPELKVLFQGAKPNMPQQFSFAVIALTSFIDRPEKMKTYAEKFKAMYPTATREEFSLIFEALLKGMKQVLDRKAPPKAINAWDAALTHLNHDYLQSEIT
ncbi:globin family protein [Thiomicrolovo sp. ZZH C-3]